MMPPESLLLPIFYRIDLQVKHNLERVLKAFRQHRVGSHHFNSVSGYGHDDLGRDTLDKVFAEIMQAESALVRSQFVSGTHAIACALYGVLRPGDECLAVAGTPYDTLE
jgi:cystathionine beta-lyase family protein involved in aluminum resistance